MPARLDQFLQCWADPGHGFFDSSLLAVIAALVSELLCEHARLPQLVRHRLQRFGKGGDELPKASRPKVNQATVHGVRQLGNSVGERVQRDGCLDVLRQHAEVVAQCLGALDLIQQRLQLYGICGVAHVVLHCLKKRAQQRVDLVHGLAQQLCAVWILCGLGHLARLHTLLPQRSHRFLCLHHRSVLVLLDGCTLKVAQRCVHTCCR
mmetsp:Transcript_21537/g.54265  ORF Transcript_21537/g.54265 Transcript_21537/m.54265 type:complete len:207 (+) Transcript_21537:2019-2639(+)